MHSKYVQIFANLYCLWLNKVLSIKHSNVVYVILILAILIFLEAQIKYWRKKESSGQNVLRLFDVFKYSS